MNLAIMLNGWWLAQISESDAFVPATAHKRILKERGWTYRAAAPVLGVDLSHLDRVLQGKRISADLLARIEELQPKGESK